MDTFFGLHVVILALLSLFGDGHLCISTVVCVSLGNTGQCYELKVQLIPMDVEIHILECDVNNGYSPDDLPHLETIC